MRAGRVTLSAHPTPQAAERRPYAELYADGSGFVAMPLSFLEDPRPEVPIHAVSLVRSTYGLVMLLAEHATRNLGLVGDAMCAFELRTAVAPEGSKTMHLTFQQMNLQHMVAGSRSLLSAPVVQRTVNLSALEHSAQERVAVTHMLLSDVFAEFGIPEGRYLTPDGTLQLRMWGLTKSENDTVEAWAKKHGVPTSFEEVDD